jgi:ubiquinone/menaquinone biosynthesis C-methylase UbiE
MVDLNEIEPLKYVPTNIIEKVNYVRCDARSLPLPDNHFDRTFCACVLLHISGIEKVLQEMIRVTKKGGMITLYVPCDPGILYRGIRHLTSHRKQSKKSEVDMKEIKYLWSLEHPNHIAGILAAIKFLCQTYEIKKLRFPFLLPSWNLNLFYVIKIIKSPV